VLFSIDDFARHTAVHGDAAALRWRRAAARVLRQRTRGMNVSARCRRDGLFLTILADVPLEGACTFAGRVRRDYMSLLRPGEPQAFSAGVAEYDDSMSSPAELMGRAERALARARSEGGRVVMVGVTTGGAVRTAAELAPLPDRVQAAVERVRQAEDRFRDAEERMLDAEERTRIAAEAVHHDLSVPDWREGRLH
jgi:GGDEF domain-containing protein